MPRIWYGESTVDGVVLRSALFECPGCEFAHAVRLSGHASVWEFNGNADLPTFAPSILVSWDHGEEHTKRACHSFVKDGRIQFLSDCWHKLAGQTVDLPEVTR